MVGMSQNTPTPAPMADDDEDCATQIFGGQILPVPPPVPDLAPKSGVFEAPPSNPPVSMVAERSSDAPVRDTIVDPPRTRWQRFKDGAARFSEQFMRDFLGTEPRLTPKLPPVPPLRKREATLVSPGVTIDAEQGEKMLLAVLLSSPQYQRAAIEVARRALAIQENGRSHRDFLVHFALSRLRPDEQGRIAITRLRDVLPSLAFARELAPALIRLEEEGFVHLVLDTRGGDPMTEILRANITHIELRDPV